MLLALFCNSAAIKKISDRVSPITNFIKLKLLDFSIGRFPYLITLLFAFSGFAFSDEVINFLKLDTNVESAIQEYAILSFVILLFAITFIQLLQHEQKDTISGMQSSLSDAQREIESSRNEIMTLQQENSYLDEQLANSINDMEYICDGYLYTISQSKLGFGEKPPCHERITLYAHDDGGYFIPVGRYSRNNDYRKKKGKIYHENKGVIGKAWSNGCYFANNYPDPQKEPDKYFQRCQEDGLSKQDFDEMRMRSRLYFGYRISRGQDDVAVIIAETTSPDRYNKIELRTIFDNQEYLVVLSEKLSRWKPSLQDAQEKGL